MSQVQEDDRSPESLGPETEVAVIGGMRLILLPADIESPAIG